MSRTRLATDSLLILALSAFLIWPLFRLEYMNNWGSIESTFIADARILSENLPHPGWQPLWYTGTRFDYIYPPALRYGTALISRVAGVSTARAYHLYTAFFYVGGILAAYGLMLAGTRSRGGAWLAAAGTALVSPCFLFLKQLRWNSGFGAPQRLHVLTLYGEGPHISALCVLPAALAAIWLAIRSWRPGMMALAALLSALVVANNFYGATALALFTPLLAWSVWVGERDWRVVARAMGIAVLAYGLSAFWLTPGYIRITLANLKLVAEPGDRRSVLLFFACVVLFGVVSFVVGRRKREREWPLFVGGSVWVLALYVLGHDYFGLQVAGNTLRLAPELDLAVMLAFATAVVWVWKRPKWRLAAGLAVGLVLFSAQKYAMHLWSTFPALSSLEGQYPREITKWTETNLRGARVLPSGDVRFWFNAWSNTPQMDGGSQQGMINQLLPDALWQVLKGDKQTPAVLWLQALGTDAVIVPGKNSRDVYRDYEFPEKFRGLPVLYDDGHDTVIYRIPRAYPGIGRVVETAAMRTDPIRNGLDVERLSKYVGETEKEGRQPVNVLWRGLDELSISARTSAGEAVLLQETWDPDWSAEEQGKRLEIRRDPAMGFMLIPVEPGEHTIRLRFETPLENRLGQFLTAASLLIILALLRFAYGPLRNSAASVT